MSILIILILIVTLAYWANRKFYGPQPPSPDRITIQPTGIGFNFTKDEIILPHSLVAKPSTAITEEEESDLTLYMSDKRLDAYYKAVERRDLAVERKHATLSKPIDKAHEKAVKALDALADSLSDEEYEARQEALDAEYDAAIDQAEIEAKAAIPPVDPRDYLAQQP